MGCILRSPPNPTQGGSRSSTLVMTTFLKENVNTQRLISLLCFNLKAVPTNLAPDSPVTIDKLNILEQLQSI